MLFLRVCLAKNLLAYIGIYGGKDLLLYVSLKISQSLSHIAQVLRQLIWHGASSIRGCHQPQTMARKKKRGTALHSNHTALLVCMRCSHSRTQGTGHSRCATCL